MFDMFLKQGRDLCADHELFKVICERERRCSTKRIRNGWFFTYFENSSVITRVCRLLLVNVRFTTLAYL